MDTDLPRAIGSYRLEARIGRGGMGEVYRAYDRKLDRHVAIKHVRPDSGDAANAQARLHREARAAARLNHSAIVQIFELIEGDDGDWIVLELVEGTTLAHRLRTGALDFAEALSTGRQIADGLAEAHSKGIVHRDLKAENVMVTPNGQVKILDFGLAKTIVKGQNDPSISVRGQVLGTSHAMSPEQARGLDVGAQSDLFSLGSLLYEMTTGVAPFRGDNLLDTLARINTHQPRPADQLNPELPRAFAQLLARLLEKAPELRPPNARAVATTLEHIALDGSRPEPVSPIAAPATAPATTADAETLERPGPLRKQRGSAPRKASVIVAITILASTGLVSTLLLSRRDNIGPDGPTSKTPTSNGPTSSGLLSPDGSPIQGRSGEPPPTVPELYDQGMALLRRFDRPGNLERARHAFQRMLAQQADSAAAYAGLARTDWRRYLFGNLEPVLLEQARAAAEQGVQLDPYLADARVSRGLVSLYQGRAEAAEDDFHEALALEPSHADAYRGLGELNASRSDFAQAEEAFRKAIELEPDNRIFHDDLGSLLFNTGRYAEAARSFEKSIEVAPDSIFGYRNLASTYFLEGRHAEATEAIQQALKIQPSATLYSSQGTIFFSQGLYEKAAQAFERALENGANKYLHWSNLADAYRRMPDRDADARTAYQRALQLLSEQIDSKPTDVSLWSRKAQMLGKLGHYGLARDELDRIEDAGAADAYSHYRVAVTHEICGQRAEALTSLERALHAGFALAEVRRDPELLDLRKDPRFHQLMVRRAEPAPAGGKP